MKFTRKYGFQWGYFESPTVPDYKIHQWYFHWDWLTKKNRQDLLEQGIPRIGMFDIYYDGVHKQLNLWFFNFHWSTQWSRLKHDD